jgi:hypothetical protein
MFRYFLFRILLFFFLFAQVSCLSQFTKWENNQIKQGYEFEKIRYQLSKGDTMAIIGFLKKDALIETYPVAAGLVHFSNEFRLEYFSLSEQHKVEKQILPKGTWVSLSRKGYLRCHLPHDTDYQGFLCMAGDKQKGPVTTFDLAGNLRSFFTPDDVKIGNIYCLGGKSNEIGLLKNGSLEFCTLSIDHNINDVKYIAGSVLSFDYNGNVSSVKQK